KKYELDITFTGAIMSFTKYVPPVKITEYVPKTIDASYDKANDLLTIDLKNDSLSNAAQKLTEITGRNFIYAPDLSKKVLNVYIKQMALKDAMDKLGFANSLKVTETDDNAFMIER